jgi:pilus assembly protein Flp/PilA
MRLLHLAAAFLKGQEGPTAVEYAVMLALLIMVCFVTVTALGTITNQTFNHPTLTSSMGGG